VSERSGRRGRRVDVVRNRSATASRDGVPEWLKAFNVRLLHSTDVRALCNAVHDAVVRP